MTTVNHNKPSIIIIYIAIYTLYDYFQIFGVFLVPVEDKNGK